MTQRRVPQLLVLTLVLMLAILTLASVNAQSSTPIPDAPAAVTSRVFGSASPVAVENSELALAMVEVAPGGAIAPHVHPGTQIGSVATGQLTYSVLTGEVRLQPGEGSECVIQAGETVVLHVGDTVIENPGGIHQAHNKGTETVVIWLSTLFPAGAPRSETIAATPTS